jgi:ribonuclease HI
MPNLPGSMLNAKALKDSEAKPGGAETIFLNFDGLCEPINPGGIATYGVVIRQGKVHLLEDDGLAFAKPWTYEASNNVAEYSALIRGLEWLKDHKMRCSKIIVRGDSILVINQLKGTYKVKAARILLLYKRAKELLGEFKALRFEWVDRSQNKEADLLSRIAYARLKREYPRTRNGIVNAS